MLTVSKNSSRNLVETVQNRKEILRSEQALSWLTASTGGAGTALSI
jgi:hypothetical protein